MQRKLSRRDFEISTLAALSGLAASGQRAAGQAPPRREDVPWLAEIQRPPAMLPPDAPQLPTVLVDSRGDRVTNRAQWDRRREEVHSGWWQFLGSWEYPRRPPEYQIDSSDRLTRLSRRLIRYQVERNVEVEAYLMVPKGIRGRVPGVVVFHSTVPYTIRQPAGLEGEPTAAWGLHLAERGFVALCPRCFLWDGSPGVNYEARVAEHAERHPNTLGMAKMVYDGRRALDLLTTIPEVDPDRLGVCGHSLGAKEALYLAAFDKRVKAGVFSEGGIGVHFSNWEAPWYLGLKPPYDHHEILSLIAPRPFLIIGGESADGAKSWPFVARAMEVYQLFGQPARIGLYNHRQGHTIPLAAEGRVYEWLQAYV
jgi:dienelactone hydrolase